MRLLALDLGGCTGWAVNGGPSGTWDIVPRRGESPGMRYIHLRRQLVVTRAAYPDLIIVVYEQAHHRGGAATEYAAGCVATVQAWCAEYGLEHFAVHSATIKKYATGKGTAKKPAMVAAAQRFKPEVTDDNEADALLLARYAADTIFSGSKVAATP